MTEIFSCIETKSILSAYFDEELSLEEKAKVEEHLLQCLKCVKELEFIKKVSDNIKNYAEKAEAVHSDLDISQKVMARLDICREISENLSAFIDKELPKDQIVKICEHLLTCEYCKRDYEDLKATQKTVQNYFEQSTDKFEIPENTYQKDIVSKTLFKQRQLRILSYSAAVVVFLSAITYFSMSFINHGKETNVSLQGVKFINKDKLITDKPVKYKPFKSKSYDQSENYLFSSVYSEPSKEVLLLIYEK